ncbi:MAG TPA: DUF2892 domain-containing protein [Pseudomonas xinjiangensis]|uniref:DUF2892 domain-containing protein n=2 Tax=root TaxID=1 RepID=A0A7V1BNM9_9GAMM|nr:DUF2892 domain-containing protein [Halopseudomonas xinjiangensis]HEC48010.1 DUF2892 domain-containing protein [Halopseudomonas xinjiangensis]
MSSNSVPSKSPSTSNQTRTFSGGVTNVQGFERVASLAGGALLLSKGLRKGGIFGVLSLAMGAGALYRGISGHCELKEKLVNKSS